MTELLDDDDSVDPHFVVCIVITILKLKIISKH